MPWFYNNETVNVKTGLFLCSIGVSIDMTVPDTINSLKAMAKKRKDYIELCKNKIEEFKKAEDEDIIGFSIIEFASKSTNFKIGSTTIVNDIAKVLLNQKDKNIEIQAHTNIIEGLDKQIKLSKIRAEMIKYSLVKKGVDANRIKTFGFGGLYSKDKKNGKNNHLDNIKIKILSKDKLKNEIVFDNLRNIRKGEVIVFSNIVFDEKSNNLLMESFSVLDKIVIILTERKNINISIQGYAMDTGNPYEDLKLATQRAHKVKKYLIEKGIVSTRILIPASGKIYSIKSRSAKIYIEIKILH